MIIIEEGIKFIVVITMKDTYIELYTTCHTFMEAGVKYL